MNERKFQVANAVVTVRGGNGWDALDRQFIINKLRPYLQLDDPVIVNRVVEFSTAVIRTVQVEGDLGFAWVTAGSSPEALLDAYNHWGTDNDGVIGLLWSNFIVMVDNDLPGDPDLYPGVDEKKDPTSP